MSSQSRTLFSRDGNEYSIQLHLFIIRGFHEQCLTFHAPLKTIDNQKEGTIKYQTTQRIKKKEALDPSGSVGYHKLNRRKVT
jgi:histidinol phosphatase-like PHP family hydrolase